MPNKAFTLSRKVDERKPLIAGIATTEAATPMMSRTHGQPASPTTLGRALQVDPIQPILIAPGTKRLNLKCDEPLSNFGFNFNLRRYTWARSSPTWRTAWRGSGGGLHSFTLELNLSNSRTHS